MVGRATHEDRTSRVYAYVHNQVTSAASRLDEFLSQQGVAPGNPVTVICDGAGEFAKTVDRSCRPLNRILDWFHIAMKFRAIEQSAWKHRDLRAPNGRTIAEEVASAKWKVWHGKAGRAIERLKAMHDMFGLVPDEPYSTLWWNLRQTYFYLRNHRKFLVNYGSRYRRGLPISSAIAESAVNEVMSLRFAKKRQMRWSDEGAHLLAQVRVSVLNGDFRPRGEVIPLRRPRDIDPYVYQLLRRAA